MYPRFLTTILFVGLATASMILPERKAFAEPILIFKETGTGTPEVLGSPVPGFWTSIGSVSFGIPFNSVFEPGGILDGTLLDAPPANLNTDLGITFIHGSRGGAVRGRIQVPAEVKVEIPLAIRDNYGARARSLKEKFRWLRFRLGFRGVIKVETFKELTIDNLEVDIVPKIYESASRSPAVALHDPGSDPDPAFFPPDMENLTFLNVLLREDQILSGISLMVGDSDGVEDFAPLFVEGDHFFPYLYVYADARPSDFGLNAQSARVFTLDFTGDPQTMIEISYAEAWADVGIPEAQSMTVYGLGALGLLIIQASYRRKRPS